MVGKVNTDSAVKMREQVPHVALKRHHQFIALTSHRALYWHMQVIHRSETSEPEHEQLDSFEKAALGEL